MKHLLAASTVLYFCFQGLTQMVNPYWAPPKTNLFTASQAGEPTNHVRGEITIQWPKDNPNLAEVTVDFVQMPGSNTVTQPDIDEASWFKEFGRKLRENDWPYYLPTNGFCGALEMRNENGQEIASLNPKGSSPEGYPGTVSFSEAKSNYFQQFQAWNGLFIPPIPVEHQRTSINFKLTNFFTITNEGEYRLTVWPKLYTRCVTNRDLGVRVDIPAVSLNFNWPAETPKGTLPKAPIP